MKKIFYIILAMALAFSSCEKQPVNQNPGSGNNTTPTGPTTPQEPERNWTYYYAGNFAYDLMDTYYLWKKEIKSQMLVWGNNIEVDPIAKIANIRYKDPKDYKYDDRWTQATDDYKTFMGEVTGITTTYGYDFYDFARDKENTDRALATVRYVYPNSPASEAGLKRGDVIVKVNGKDIPIIWQGTSGSLDVDFIYDQMVYSSNCTLTLKDGSKVSMTAREMVENPVIMYRILDNGEKKIGYLHYTSFTAESCAPLIEACQYFKSEGIKELVLDLRYNGGGAVVAEEVLISMLAPRADVEAGEIFEKEIYNADYGKYLAEEAEKQGLEAGVSRFSFQHDFRFDGKDYHFNTEDANIGLEKIYCIVTGDSASASEALICCLKPFMTVVLVGQKTHGKYCGGYIISSDEYFQDIKDTYNDPKVQQAYSLSANDIAEATTFANNGLKYASNWGLYVMFSSYSDRDGVTLCKPDGIKPDYSAMDNPQDGFQLGDPNETMLKSVLKRAGFTVAESSGTQQQAPARFDTGVEIKFQRREKPGMVRELTSLPGHRRDPQIPLLSNDWYTRAE